MILLRLGIQFCAVVRYYSVQSVYGFLSLFHRSLIVTCHSDKIHDAPLLHVKTLLVPLSRLSQFLVHLLQFLLGFCGFFRLSGHIVQSHTNCSDGGNYYSPWG